MFIGKKNCRAADFSFMKTGMDFLNVLEPDMSIKVLSYLEDPSDLVRASCVSHSWRHFVIAKSLCKAMCLRMFPQLHKLDHLSEGSGIIVKDPSPTTFGSWNSKEWETLVREHHVYASFARSCINFDAKECIGKAVFASSTKTFPRDLIYNTLEPSGWFWLSRGQKNRAVPETLVYKLVADLCVITEICIQPSQDSFQQGEPIYSANFVRFRAGYLKSGMASKSWLMSTDENFIWTYSSPVFPMAQENSLQKFRLPKPVLCIGGYVQIELLDRVQTKSEDGLFYLCISQVQVIGKSLARSFGVDILEPSDNFILKVFSHRNPAPLEEEEALRDYKRVLAAMYYRIRSWASYMN